ncbi:polysaccharide pyruvyl transferase family protein [Halomonas sediminis]
MSQPHFALCGAFDRHNYGDILFPLIHRHVICGEYGEGADVSCYAVKQADLTNIGGVRAETMSTLIKRIRQAPAQHNVIFCGGDILSADWVTMLGHHLPSDLLCRGLAAGRRLLGFERANELLRKAYQQPARYPYVMDPKERPLSLHYTAVGASGFNIERNPQHLHDVAALLKGASEVSVRDREAQQRLQEAGVDARLVPDTALIMSDIYPLDELAKQPWQEDIDTQNGFKHDHYLVFQTAKSYVAGQHEQVAEQLADIAAATGYSILLLPIGRATGHSDAQILKKLFEMLKQRGIPCALQQSPHVLHIMASLAFSQAYIGTSLHGAITAYAFGRRVCGIATQRVKKLHAFIGTWLLPEEAVSVPDTHFIDAFNTLLEQPRNAEAAQQLAVHKGLIYDDIKRYLQKASYAA